MQQTKTTFDVPTAANDNGTVAVHSWPSMFRYIKEGDTVKAQALHRWADLGRPAQWQTGIQAANDNATEAGWEKACWAEQIRIDKLDRERLLEIRPTPNELMLLSAGRRKPTFTRQVRATLGALNFLNGRLTHWQVGDKRFTPRTLLRGLKGGRSAGRTAASIDRYLKTPGVPNIPQWQTHDGARTIEATPEKVAAREALAALGVDGSVPREMMPVPVTVGPTAPAKGAHWFGGVVGSNQGKQQRGAAINASEIEVEMDRFGEGQRLRNKLDPATVEILDCAASRMTARQIGEQFGKGGKYAERWAVKAIDAALEKIAA